MTQFLGKPGLYFPYKTSMTHGRHQTEAEMALKQVQKLKRHYEEVLNSEHSNHYESVADSYKWRTIERYYDRLKKAENVLQLVKKISDVERAGQLNHPYGFSHREMQREIVAAARAYGIGLFVNGKGYTTDFEINMPSFPDRVTEAFRHVEEELFEYSEKVNARQDRLEKLPNTDVALPNLDEKYTEEGENR
ncbi:hypothetical protein KY092_08120 [Natronomonas gomsonensis]|uniref:hypothetical protein n=1 Tax=Natronomonas gomsonensis TaxID=1046043 RepID=UPI0020CA64D3|nr:hypothetical protein [Natronomonas gomsonensis]MCY4730523.1 hypothetical protein [Natronomonas gomsonensis]